MKRVVIVQRRMTHYRLPLFEQLRERLRDRDIALEVLAGEGTATEKRKSDSGTLSWARPLRTFYFANGRLCLQLLGKYLANADLVVVTQENKLLYNHWLVLMPRRNRLAFWGHGANLQSSRPDGLRERYKNWTTNRVDWWFAYTDTSAELIRGTGFPADRITVLDNAVDTRQFAAHLASITAAESHQLKHSLGMDDGPVGISVGSLYKEKRLDLLLDAALAIRRAIPEFSLLILGDGPERERIESFCADNAWARWRGVSLGREKALYFSISHIMLNPGAVGLGILDSFVSGVPLVTRQGARHGPEIAYLRSGITGLITAAEGDVYTRECVALLRDSSRLQHLRDGCLRAAEHYSIENMVGKFCGGIEQAVAQA